MDKRGAAATRWSNQGRSHQSKSTGPEKSFCYYSSIGGGADEDCCCCCQYRQKRVCFRPGPDASLIVPPSPERHRARVVKEELNRFRVEDQRREDEHQRTIAEVQAQCAEVKKKCHALDEVFRWLASQGVDVTQLLRPQQPESSSSQNSVRHTSNLADK